MRLKNKVSIITGAAQGIGLATALKFAEEGATVIVCDMHPAGVDAALAMVRARGAQAQGFAVNVTDRDAIDAMVAAVKDHYGHIDVLVNNAGITRDAMTRKMTDEQWDAVIAVNLKGVFNLTRHVGPYMQAQGGGSIISISSVVGVFGNIGQANYAATKSAIFGLTKTWAKEFSLKGGNVRVNAIAPGYTLTDIVKTVPQDLLDKFASMTMLGRMGEPEEIARAALFLASEDASYVTGQILQVDGGMRL
jgi:3-oxoacyl-[acyl-carrier protein] reductase